LSEVTSLTISEAEVVKAVATALEILPPASAGPLNDIISDEVSFDNVKVAASLESIITNDAALIGLASAFGCVVHVVMVRRASGLLMQIATPESIFARR
jgi:hypothetical protein